MFGDVYVFVVLFRLPVVATGTLAGLLAVWDLQTQKLRVQCQHESGVVRLCWDKTSEPLLYTCTLDGSCYMWDARTGKSEASWMGHSEEVLDMDISQ